MQNISSNQVLWQRSRRALGVVCSAVILLGACGGANNVPSPLGLQDLSDGVLSEDPEVGPLPELLAQDPNAALMVPTVVLASAITTQSPVIPAPVPASVTSTANAASSSLLQRAVATVSAWTQALGISASAALPDKSLPSVAATLLAPPVPDPGVLMLLLPDGQNMADPGVSAWVDAASELGVRVQPITDAQFLALGDSARDFAGLILPDGLHVQATDALLAAVKTFTQQGGRCMLVFDFGALTTLSDGTPVYPIPKSRLSDMAGVDYVMYEALRDQTTGLGPVTAKRSTLRSLLVPPGKSLPFVGLAASSAAAPLLSAAQISSDAALYLPVGVNDAGGARGFDPQQYSRMSYAKSSDRSVSKTSGRQVQIDLGRAFQAPALPAVSQPLPDPMPTSTKSADTVVRSAALLAGDEPLEAYSGYLLGPLIYPSYVTAGEFGNLPGQKVLATSPQFGLVAGVNPVGAGQVLFVNLPLTYLKGRTDALMMHGYLNFFVREVLDLPHLSSMPNGVGGMSFDWHLDAKAAQAPTGALIKLKVFSDPQALFSIEMTAGPDAIVAGDRLGWNLARNKTAQQYLKTFKAAGHSVGSHGGWIHDFYGLNVSETNELVSTGGACLNPQLRLDNFMQCLVINRRDVDAATGFKSRSYSSPEGNNPMWSMDWHEQQGVVSTYFAGHTGLGGTRQYRDGRLLNPGLWVFPVTPAGLYATYEEFQDYKVPQSEIIAWKREMIDFGVTHNTARMIYAHPPGAYLWRNVLLDMLSYAKSKGPQFAWYTMERLADFMNRRLQVSWSQSLDPGTGQTVFMANHPQSLQEMVWRLPKSRFVQAPVIVSGSATVDGTDARFWLVKAQGGTQLVFRS